MDSLTFDFFFLLADRAARCQHGTISLNIAKTSNPAQTAATLVFSVHHNHQYTLKEKKHEGHLRTGRISYPLRYICLFHFFWFCISLQTFRVYSSGNSGPVLFLLHGAGHTGLSWACFAVGHEVLVFCSSPAYI